MRRAKLPQAAPPAPPPCAHCLAPATVEIRVEARDLVLVHREGSANLPPYWTTTYESTRVALSTRLCDECVRASFRTSVDVAATLEHAKRGAP